MNEPNWLLPQVVEAMHDTQLAEHGGPVGIRDAGMLDSALARARNAYAYGETDLHALAACYAFGLARNHPFVDGNKRTAFLAAFVFLRINGRLLATEQVDAVRAVLALAAGACSEADFADWLRANTRPA